ncbi:methyl-accepting chemotaxis protein [Duganella sp. PWIR1]
MRLRTWTIGARMRAGFAVILVLLVAVAVFGIGAMGRNQARMDESTVVNSHKARDAMAMRDTVFRRMIALRNIVLVGSAAEVQDEMTGILRQEQQYAARSQQLRGMLDRQGTQERALFDKIAVLDAAARPLTGNVFDMVRSAQTENVYNLLTAQLLPLQSRWLASLEELIALEDALTAQAIAQARDEYLATRAIMVALGFAALIAGVAVSVLLTRSLRMQLGGEPVYAARIAGEIAGGDLAGEIALRHGGADSLLGAMKGMRDRLAGIVGDVRANTDTIALATGDIAAGNQELSQRTDEQAGLIRHIVLSIESLAGAVANNADHARQGKQLTVAASAVAQRGGQAVAQVEQTMQAISVAAGKIEAIIAVIDGIAFQTNILALNAAVEAARAGEQGRGFAVVASEVRHLAQRSSEAAKEIKGLIGDSVQQVRKGGELVEQAGATMDDIVVSVQQVSAIMAEISAASEEQRASIEQINGSVAHIDHVTQQNAALVKDAAAAAASLCGQARELAALVQVFKVAEPRYLPLA